MKYAIYGVPCTKKAMKKHTHNYMKKLIQKGWRPDETHPDYDRIQNGLYGKISATS